MAAAAVVGGSIGVAATAATTTWATTVMCARSLLIDPLSISPLGDVSRSARHPYKRKLKLTNIYK